MSQGASPPSARARACCTRTCCALVPADLVGGRDTMQQSDWWVGARAHSGGRLAVSACADWQRAARERSVAWARLVARAVCCSCVRCSCHWLAPAASAGSTVSPLLLVSTVSLHCYTHSRLTVGSQCTVSLLLVRSLTVSPTVNLTVLQCMRDVSLNPFPALSLTWP